MESHYRLTRPSQLAVFRLDDLVGTHPLVFCPPADDFCLYLSQELAAQPMTVFGLDYAIHRLIQKSFQAGGVQTPDLLFGPIYQPDQREHKAAIIFLPKGRELVEMSLHMVAAALKPGSRVFLVGENNAGIRSYRAVLERLIGPVEIVEAARHNVLFRARLTVESRPFNLDSWSGSYRLKVGGDELTIISFPGVFSHARLDAGTRLLIENLVPSPQVKILDFGCGSGAIGVAALKTYPQAKVDLVDSSALALEAARRTLKENGLSSATIYPSNVFSDIHSSYSLILSNPPFHTGVQTEYRVAVDFIKQAVQHLDLGGALRLVVNRFLKYQPLLENAFQDCRVVAEDSRYRVYESIKRN